MDAITLSRIEVWDDFEAAGGSRLAFEGRALLAQETESVESGDTLRIRLPVNGNAWPVATDLRVLRTVLSDGSWKEWRIFRPTSQRDGSNAVDGLLVCESPLTKLSEDVVERVESNGSVSHDFGLYGVAPADLAEFILGFAPSIFAAGTIDPTDPVDLIFEWDSPLAALRQLAELTSSDLTLTRDVDGRYLVNLIAVEENPDPSLFIRYRKNELGIKRDRDADALLTRAYPRGASLDGFHSDMGAAAWLVASIDGSTVDLGEDAIAFDDQFNGLFVQVLGGGPLIEIVDTVVADQQLVLASAPGFNAGDRIHVRRDAAGTALTYLDNPVARAKYLSAGQHKSKVVDLPDIPGINNLVENPYLSDWTPSLVGWTAITAAAIASESSGLFKRYGSRSARVEAIQDDGIESAWVPINPTEGSPYFSARIALLVVSGQVRLELVVEDNDGEEYIYPDTEIASTTVIGTWVENLAIAGLDLAEISATRCRIRVIAHAGDATFYLDAAQVTQSAGGAEAIYNGRAANDLWREANRTLIEHGEVEETFDIQFADLQRLSPDEYPAEKVELRAAASVTDSELGIAITTRIVEVVRDLLVPGAGRIRLSSHLPSLTGQLTGTTRRDRPTRDVPTVPGPAAPFGAVTASTTSNGGVTGSFAGNDQSRSFGWRISKDAPGPEAEDAPTGLEILNSRSGTFGSSGFNLGEDETAYVTGFFFSQENGKGQASKRVLARVEKDGISYPIDPEHPLSDGNYLSTLRDLRRRAADVVSIAQAFVFSANTAAGDAGTEISRILTQPLFDPTGTVEYFNTTAGTLREIAFGSNVRDQLGRQTNRMLAKPTSGDPDDARGLLYFAGGATLESLKPLEAGANVTESRTSNDVLYGPGRAVRQFGADITGANTSADVLTGPGRAVAQHGADVTGANTASDVQVGSGKAVQEAGANRTESRTSANTSAVGGQSAGTVNDGVSRANTGLKSGSGEVQDGKVRESAIVDLLFADAAIVNRIFAENSFSNAVFAKLVSSDVVLFSTAAGENVTAGFGGFDELSAFSAVLGEIVGGVILDTYSWNSPQAAFRISNGYGIPGSVQRFIDLAGGTGVFISHPALVLANDGTAEFSGELSAASGTFVGDVLLGGTSKIVFGESGGVELTSYSGGEGFSLSVGGSRFFTVYESAGQKKMLFFEPGVIAGGGRQNVTGSKGGNAALSSLISALATLGLITNSTS